jgi:peptidoglycan/xylan/chitin deacetylase (PgdA/CDA1 family)
VNVDRVRSAVKAMARRALSSRPIGGAVRKIAALRGRSLVLVYHRVLPEPPPPPTVVPTISSAVFRRQLEALGEVGEIAPLETLIRDHDPHGRPRFALTFDDDYATHVEHALPELGKLGVPATFFVSGRSLHGLGSYWFELLERLIAERGVAKLTSLLGASGDGVEGLIDVCERDPASQKVVEAEADDEPHQLGRADIEALTAAGMAIGFHTVHHEVLPRLDDGELDVALTLGRRELEHLVGGTLSHFAYPHGKADARTARRVRDAGFDAAWTGRPQAMDRRENRYLLGRWEPGAIDLDEFLIGTAIRLTRRTRP